MSDDERNSDAYESIGPYSGARRGGRSVRPNSGPQHTSIYDNLSTPRTAAQHAYPNTQHSGLPMDQLGTDSNYQLSGTSLHSQGHVPSYVDHNNYQFPTTHRSQAFSNASLQHTPPTRQTQPGSTQPRANIVPQPAHPKYLSSEDSRVLDPRYVRQSNCYYKPGKVFSILWHEIDGRNDSHRYGTHLTEAQYRGKFGEPVYSTIRRMVVIKTFDTHSWCFSISTYGGRGVAKPGVDPSKHAIVYIARGGSMEPSRVVGEPPMTKEPIEVEPERYDETLDPKSRLNFGKIYTVEHYVKVLPIGKISRESMPKFENYAKIELKL